MRKSDNGIRNITHYYIKKAGKYPAFFHAPQRSGLKPEKGRKKMSYIFGENIGHSVQL